jgi:hypothetical protein
VLRQGEEQKEQNESLSFHTTFEFIEVNKENSSD